MNSPEPRHSDELDELIKAALTARVNRCLPPNKVWRRVQADIEGRSRPARVFRPSLRLSTIAQTAFLLLAMWIGGVDIQPVTLFQADSGLSPLLMSQYQIVTPVAVEVAHLPVVRDAADAGVPALPDRLEIRALKDQAYQTRREKSYAGVEDETLPLFLPPTDVFPHSTGLATRKLTVSAPPVAFLEALFFPQRVEPGLGVIQ